MKERKTREREAAREKRRAIGADERARKSELIRSHVLELPEVADARFVGCYVSVHSEVDTLGLLQALIGRHQRVVVPVVLRPEHMVLAELGILEELRPGAHDIPEPMAPLEVPPPAQVDVILMPGLLFTTDGHRLGNGGGYFDRMLARMPHARRIGLAFEEQVVDALPFEAHDQHLDALVTDARVLHFER